MVGYNQDGLPANRRWVL